jgi:hypothetical protein
MIYVVTFSVAVPEMARTVYDQYTALFCLVECVLWFAVLGVSALVMFSRFNARCHAGVYAYRLRMLQASPYYLVIVTQE